MLKYAALAAAFAASVLAGPSPPPAYTVFSLNAADDSEMLQSLVTSSGIGLFVTNGNITVFNVSESGKTLISYVFQDFYDFVAVDTINGEGNDVYVLISDDETFAFGAYDGEDNSFVYVINMTTFTNISFTMNSGDDDINVGELNSGNILACTPDQCTVFSPTGVNLTQVFIPGYYKFATLSSSNQDCFLPTEGGDSTITCLTYSKGIVTSISAVNTDLNNYDYLVQYSPNNFFELYPTPKATTPYYSAFNLNEDNVWDSVTIDFDVEIPSGLPTFGAIDFQEEAFDYDDINYFFTSSGGYGNQVAFSAVTQSSNQDEPSTVQIQNILASFFATSQNTSSFEYNVSCGNNQEAGYYTNVQSLTFSAQKDLAAFICVYNISNNVFADVYEFSAGGQGIAQIYKKGLLGTAEWDYDGNNYIEVTPVQYFGNGVFSYTRDDQDNSIFYAFALA